MKVQLPIKNFPAQQTIFDAPERFKIVVKGRRFGMTKGAANYFITQALRRKFKRGLWVDTVNSNIERYVERFFIPHLKKLPADQWKWRKQVKILNIFDSYIDFRSVDNPENIEGEGYDLGFLNEAGIILKDRYLWDNAIRPMFWDNPNSVVIIGGTPKGGGGVFEELAQRGKDPDQPNYAYFHFTTYDNPYLNHELLESEHKDLTQSVLQQEVYAQFLSDSGAVFRNIKNISVATPKGPRSGHLYVMGVDLAKVQDWTVITVYDRSNNRQVYQDRFQSLDWTLQKQKIAGIARVYNNAIVYIDATGVGDPIADDLLSVGVSVEPIRFTNESKKQMIEKAMLYTEQSRVYMIYLPETVKEFQNFTYDMSSSGRIIYNAPAGFHDDIVWSHCLAIWGLNPIYEKQQPEEPSRIQEYKQRIGISSSSDPDIEYEIVE